MKITSLFFAGLLLCSALCSAGCQPFTSSDSTPGRTLDLAGDIVPDFDQRLATLSAQDTLATRTADGKIPLTERVGILNRAFAQLGYSYDKSLIAVLKRPDIVQLVRLDARSILDVLHCPLDALDEPGAMDMVTKGYLSEECYRLLVQTKHKVLTQKSDTLSTQS